MKRIIAIIALVLFALCLIATLGVAIFGGKENQSWLIALLFCDIVIPAVIYAYQLVTRIIRKKTDKK